MKLIVLHGPPATGKLTVARELAALTGYPVFHNHAAVDLLLSVFEFGSPPFVRLRELIWLEVMGEAAAHHVPGLIFTFAPERSVDPDFVSRLTSRIELAGGTVLFVQLKCPEDEIEARLNNDSRGAFKKLRSLGTYRGLREAGMFEFPPLPDSGLAIDTSLSSPLESAQHVVEHFGLGRE